MCIALATPVLPHSRIRESSCQGGLSDFVRHYPDQLSGGMQQRANLARMLVNRPELLLMDEPFGALDAQTRLQMQEPLLNLWGEYGMTVVFVTHDVDEAILLSDRVLSSPKSSPYPVGRCGGPGFIAPGDRIRLFKGQLNVYAFNGDCICTDRRKMSATSRMRSLNRTV
jgi:NitT/TauT family transport system ATP-binding protein